MLGICMTKGDGEETFDCNDLQWCLHVHKCIDERSTASARPGNDADEAFSSPICSNHLITGLKSPVLAFGVLPTVSALHGLRTNPALSRCKAFRKMAPQLCPLLRPLLSLILDWFHFLKSLRDGCKEGAREWRPGDSYWSLSCGWAFNPHPKLRFGCSSKNPRSLVPGQLHLCVPADLQLMGAVVSEKGLSGVSLGAFLSKLFSGSYFTSAHKSWSDQYEPKAHTFWHIHLSHAFSFVHY